MQTRALLCGRQSCLQAAFQAAVGPEHTSHAVRLHFSGLASRRHRAAKPEKLVSKQGGRLKACLQPGLAAPRKAKADWRAPLALAG